MSVTAIFLLLGTGLAAGLCLSATWNYARNKGFAEGYEQAIKEEEMRHQAAKHRQEQIEALSGMQVRTRLEAIPTADESNPVEWGHIA